MWDDSVNGHLSYMIRFPIPSVVVNAGKAVVKHIQRKAPELGKEILIVVVRILLKK
jgi:hypothetical protein